MAEGKGYSGPPIKLSMPAPVSSAPSLGQPTIMSRRNLQDLAKGVDPTEQLDEDVEDLLLKYAETFMEETMEGACSLSKHRKATSVECKDVQTYLERKSNCWMAGFGNEELRPYKRAPMAEAHKQRMALIKKSLKKY